MSQAPRVASPAVALVAVTLGLLSASFAPLLVAPLASWASTLAYGLCLCAPAMVVLRSHGLPASSIGFNRPRATALLGGALVGLFFWLINANTVVPLSLAMFGDQGIRAMAETTRQMPTIVAAMTLVVVPALAEEILFRGLLLPSLARRLGTVAAVVLSTLPFALLHTPWVRTAPALATGLILASVRVNGRSLWPVITAHLINNLSALWLADWLPADLGPALGLTLGLAGTTLGFLLLCRRPASL